MFLRVLVLMSVLLAPLGCAHAAPSWVEGGSRIVGPGARPVLYGVGVARGAADPAVARATAANRARHEIVRLLRPDRPIRAARLTGVEIRAFHESGDGTVYALAVYRPARR